MFVSLALGIGVTLIGLTYGILRAVDTAHRANEKRLSAMHAEIIKVQQTMMGANVKLEGILAKTKE